MNQKLLDNIRSMNEAELYAAIYKDALTDANNRRAFDQTNSYSTVAIVDMDSLKYLNDEYGHRTGDQYMINLVDILRTHFGDENVYRLGGDEFAVTSYLSCEALNVKLTHIQRKVEFFTFGTGLYLAEADDKLNANKERREKCGQRAARGECPPWEIKNICA